jgi:exonuclease SbcC
VEGDLKQRYGWQAELGQLGSITLQIEQIQQTQAELTAQLDTLSSSCSDRQKLQPPWPRRK